ncbi:IclR family transcriptional regulator [Nocardioides sp.]|uniref:IclR family transcriptional regulator n=1 Tax=Nocardioides sp. TaxID=35761 RepID=UPI002602C28B|nr:IclR family transcriptional regulator [Nocardioides sp.]
MTSDTALRERSAPSSATERTGAPEATGPAATDQVGSARDDRAAVDKAISLLVAFGDQSATGVGVSELARRAQLSKSTAFRVLQMLERNGVVERLGTSYRLGTRLAELGRSVYAADHDRLRDQLTPFVTDLYEATHETVHLAALHGTDVVYLTKLFGHRHVKSPTRVGGRVPAYATAVGKALLAFDPHGLELTLARQIVRFTTATVPDHDRLQEQLIAVRSTGIAREDEEVVPGLACLAAPVFGPNGIAVAAISVSVPAGRLDQARLEPLLRQIASSASHALSTARPVGRGRARTLAL